MASALSVSLRFPEARVFQFPPGPHPPLIRPAPPVERSWDRPIDVSSRVYTLSLDARIPLYTACFYILFVCVLNHVNRKRQYRPWPVTRTASFTYVAFIHNILLSVFSAWVFLGVCQAVVSSLPPQPWAPYHIADAFCRFDHAQESGPPLSGYNAANSTSAPLTTNDDSFSRATLVKSLWERGLNYYTWMFYVSKYYEIMDTLLLLVKGKRVSFLQMYHHAGAIICTRWWASP
ncbi:GNS1/SUR4 family-domain-containing protein [Aspergillus bertholletiae]|uniref:Elongation of fatty acids protein n=1 Tax=Aspergillus bertholletiae TaxID=1226010 RepID=A0A5N7B951_9EURO|nr:GNS1/SUR4 family-domain-containing protein [Aspergillus bertholletiae]